MPPGNNALVQFLLSWHGARSSENVRHFCMATIIKKIPESVAALWECTVGPSWGWKITQWYMISFWGCPSEYSQEKLTGLPSQHTEWWEMINLVGFVFLVMVGCHIPIDNHYTKIRFSLMEFVEIKYFTIPTGSKLWGKYTLSYTASGSINWYVLRRRQFGNIY